MYQRFRINPPTLSRLCYLCIPGYSILLISFWLISWFWLAWEQDFNAWLTWGFACGMLCRDILILQKTAHLWPVLTEVLDWQKIDELLGNNGQADSQIH